ncbi:MAG TPA: SPOR domain-containing protein [Thermoanaerobaculia bacterium]|nr:SPOR domain-containing protein [Thermoanaerobaculia bacterium]
MSEPRTHYQISLTARQAVGLFAGLLLALGLAFFFGLMTGYSGRDARAAEKSAASRVAAESTPAPGSEAPPPVETGVAVAEPKADTAAATTPSPEPTTPATIHPFEDSTEDEAAAAQASGSRTSVSGAPAAPVGTPAPGVRAPSPSARVAAAPAAGKVWVQAASLSSHDEANALGVRLSKHGFHSIVLAASGPRGKVYRVRVGPYRSEDEATRAMAKLTKQEKIRQPWIVPDGK